MKKTLLIVLLVFVVMFLVSCSNGTEKAEDVDNTTAVSSSVGNSESNSSNVSAKNETVNNAKLKIRQMKILPKMKKLPQPNKKQRKTTTAIHKKQQKATTQQPLHKSQLLQKKQLQNGRPQLKSEPPRRNPQPLVNRLQRKKAA